MSARIRVVREPGNGTRAGRRSSGLPGPLPAGERMLWQGAPQWRSVARRALHVRQLAGYFGLLAAICLWRALAVQTAQMWFSLATLVVLSGVALGMLALFAVLVARTTTYTLTDRRVVLRVGVALGMSINLPFAMIDAASVRMFPDGTGDIPLLLAGQTRIGWTMLWPHVRPWHTRRVQPMLRGVAGAAGVAQLLVAGLAESAGQAATTVPAAHPATSGRPVREQAMPANAAALGG